MNRMICAIILTLLSLAVATAITALFERSVQKKVREWDG